MHWIAPSEKDTATAALVPSLSASDGERGENYSGDPSKELSIHGVEQTDETGRLNLRPTNPAQ